MDGVEISSVFGKKDIYIRISTIFPDTVSVNGNSNHDSFDDDLMEVAENSSNLEHEDEEAVSDKLNAIEIPSNQDPIAPAAAASADDPPDQNMPAEVDLANNDIQNIETAIDMLRSQLSQLANEKFEVDRRNVYADLPLAIQQPNFIENRQITVTFTDENTEIEEEAVDMGGTQERTLSNCHGSCFRLKHFWRACK